MTFLKALCEAQNPQLIVFLEKQVIITRIKLNPKMPHLLYVVVVVQHLKKIIKYILTIFLSIILLLLLFVGITNNELKGTYIGEYSVHTHIEAYLPYERIMTLGNFSYFEQGPKYEITKERKGYFLNIFSIIKSKYNTYKVVSINKDSLQLKNEFHMESNYKTFRRIDDSLKNNQKINLVGKKFIFSNYKVSDTILFKNDSLYKSLNSKIYSNWQLIEHNGFQILFLREFLPFIVKNQNGNNIELKRLENPSDNYKMTEIE